MSVSPPALLAILSLVMAPPGAAVAGPGPAGADSMDLVGLPVVEAPVAGRGVPTLAVLLSGDGGWAAGDKAMAEALNAHGVPVVGFDVPSYLRVPRTPDGAAADLQRLLEYYFAAWHRSSVIVIGYSHGADLAPFLVSRLRPEVREHIALVALLGLEPEASFRFHLADLLAPTAHAGDLPVRPELDRLHGVPLLCVRGAEEHNSLCESLSPQVAEVATRPGGHRIPGREGSEVVDLILAAAPSIRSASPR
jgi:type IV secretory pathway VirJ component